MTVKTFPRIDLICVKAQIRSGANIMRHLIPGLWEQLKQASEFTNVSDMNRYALITGDLPNLEEPEAYYIAGLRAQSNGTQQLPEGFFYHTIPEGLVASCLHAGSPMNLGTTTEQVFKNWLPTSNLKLRSNQELIIFPPNYDRQNPNSQFEYILFVE